MTNQKITSSPVSAEANAVDKLSKRPIIDYYESCESDYRLFWNLDHSMAMHAGFWDDTTKSLSDALNRENEVLAEIAQISTTDRVLDAGCGVGGSSIFLASRYGCNVIGITLSSKQASKALSNATKYGVAPQVSFQVRDYCNTQFPDASFDVVWGLESVCHATDKAQFVKEAYRLLKPGGRMILADGFASKTQYIPQEAYEMKKWLKGWGVDSLETVGAFENHLYNNGFQQINFRNITKNVLPSSRRLYFISFPATAFSKVGEWLGLRHKIQTENIRSAYFQYTTLKKGLWCYGIFSGKKD